jgi:SAM-dependent methyltransferase
MPAHANCDWYDTPLYYDIIFDEGTAMEADFLETMHLRYGKKRGAKSSLELACGSGRLIKELRVRRWKTAGFDLNANMLAYARKRVGTHPDAILWEDRMESFSVPGRRKFDLVHCLVSTFKYLHSEKDALACLNRVARSLNQGGLFVLGVHLTDPENKRPSHERWVAHRDGIEVVCNTRTWPPDPRSRLESMRSRLRVTFPDGGIKRQETHWKVRSYTASQLRSLIRKSGAFTLCVVHDFHHDPDTVREFDDSYSDLVLVLRRK